MRISGGRLIRDCGDIEARNSGVADADAAPLSLAMQIGRMAWEETRCGDIAPVTGGVCGKHITHEGEHSDGAQVWADVAGPDVDVDALLDEYLPYGGVQ